jgi:tRNA/tmRNA/rRNA uracil-C5-methylase (TrmA/RlmC/RlmD family)
MNDNFKTILSIKRIGINGEGIGYYKRKAVFVPFALPEEEIICEFVKDEKNYINGVVESIKKQSPHRVKAPCPYFGKCGGCQLQHLEYNEQIKMKKDLIVQSLTRYLDNHEQLNIDIKDTIGSKETYYYRNKAQMPVAFDRNKMLNY